MPLYQMLVVTKHFPEYMHIRALVQQSCLHLLDNGATVRNLHYWGLKELPQRMKRHGYQDYHSKGDYWTTHFDCAPRTVNSLNALMRVDPRVLRWSILKLANKPTQIAAHGNVITHGSTHQVEHLL